MATTDHLISALECRGWAIHPSSDKCERFNGKDSVRCGYALSVCTMPGEPPCYVLCDKRGLYRDAADRLRDLQRRLQESGVKVK